MANAVLKDYLIPDTPMRALIIRGDYCLLAYLGVPREHWVAGLEEVDFRCHWSITFRGLGDGGARAEGWYWFGWDYGHAGDAWQFEFLKGPAAQDLPPEVVEMLTHLQHRPASKRWTVEEVQADVTEAALDLWTQLQLVELKAAEALEPKKV